MKQCELQRLSQFNGHKVQISNKDNSITYRYSAFAWEVDDGILVLSDGTESDCNTYVNMDDGSFNVSYLSDDLYRDVIDIVYGDSRISICIGEVK